MLADLKAAELPLTPALPLGQDARSAVHVLLPSRATRSRPTARSPTSSRGSAEIWSSLKSPIWAQEQIAQNLGLPPTSVTVPRRPGRRLVRPPPVRRRRVRGGGDLAEARQAGEADVAPDRQLPPGPRAPDVHLARAHHLLGQQRARASTSGTRASRPTSPTGSASCSSATYADLPEAELLGYSQAMFTLTANVPYNFGVGHPAAERDLRSTTRSTPASVRNIYSPEVCTAKELMVDQVAKAMGQDPYKFRRSFVRDDRLLAVLDTVAKAGSWGRPMPTGTAQGIGDPQRVQGPRRVPGRDRLHARDRQPPRRERLHRPARHQGRVRRRRRPADQPARARRRR